MLSQNDIVQLQTRNITEQQIFDQLTRLKKGTSFSHLICPATVGMGIKRMDDPEKRLFIETFENDKSYYRLAKFVPASGAASRMFKDLFSFIERFDRQSLPTNYIDQHLDEPVGIFFNNLQHFAFYDELNQAVLKLYGKDLSILLRENKLVEIAKALLLENGLSYGKKPKALLTFHQYEGFCRMALEEHFREAVEYSCNADGVAHLHFTVSPEHELLFRKNIEALRQQYEQQYHVQLEIELSTQKPSTDTIALNDDGEPFRNVDGSLLFRPGGHGALIENLNELQEEIVFIKNIDNVAIESKATSGFAYKKMLAGYLVHLQQQSFEYLELLDEGNLSDSEVNEILCFARDMLTIDIPAFVNDYSNIEKIDFLYDRLNRPMRVCGVVRNDGEPGGGPYWVRNNDDEISLQIVESSQINHENPEQESIFRNATHFNPVDLVCGCWNYKGEAFNLTDYVDHDTAFVSFKSQGGRELKALELPGLWNGAMADWITVFVEVPTETFNPVKTVNDLLKNMHQP